MWLCWSAFPGSWCQAHALLIIGGDQTWHASHVGGGWKAEGEEPWTCIHPRWEAAWERGG